MVEINFYLHRMRLSAGRLSISEDGTVVTAEDIWNTRWYAINVELCDSNVLVFFFTVYANCVGFSIFWTLTNPRFKSNLLVQQLNIQWRFHCKTNGHLIRTMIFNSCACTTYIRTNNYGNHRVTPEVGIHHFVWVSILATDETASAPFGNITGGALITIKGFHRQQWRICM